MTREEKEEGDTEEKENVRNSVCLTKEKEDEPKAAPKLELHRRALPPVFSFDTLRVLDTFTP